MKMVKSLLLGSAAGIVAVAGAQAADLPVKAKPVEYVRVCSLYGAGFWYVPGTDTCLKVGSFIREQVEWNAGNGGVPIGFGSNDEAAAGRNTRSDTSQLSFRTRTESRSICARKPNTGCCGRIWQAASRPRPTAATG